jgi:hypothetical protein
MSEENVEVVRQMYDAFYRGDADGALAHFDLGGKFDDAHVEVHELIDAGDQVFGSATFRGRGMHGLPLFHTAARSRYQSWRDLWTR